MIFILCAEVELAAHGGLTITGWLESPSRGVIWPSSIEHLDEEKGIKLNFSICQGTPYELVSAAYGRGRMLTRFQNIKINIPNDIKKGKKKCGQMIPMIEFINT